MDDILQRQRQYFLAGATLPVKNRVRYLKALKSCIIEHEEEIYAALKSDLSKSAT